jgi:hypothetical protein
VETCIGFVVGVVSIVFLRHERRIRILTQHLGQLEDSYLEFLEDDYQKTIDENFEYIVENYDE